MAEQQIIVKPVFIPIGYLNEIRMTADDNHTVPTAEYILQ